MSSGWLAGWADDTGAAMAGAMPVKIIAGDATAAEIVL